MRSKSICSHCALNKHQIRPTLMCFFYCCNGWSLFKQLAYIPAAIKSSIFSFKVHAFLWYCCQRAWIYWAQSPVSKKRYLCYKPVNWTGVVKVKALWLWKVHWWHKCLAFYLFFYPYQPFFIILYGKSGLDNQMRRALLPSISVSVHKSQTLDHDSATNGAQAENAKYLLLSGTSVFFFYFHSPYSLTQLAPAATFAPCCWKNKALFVVLSHRTSVENQVLLEIVSCSILFERI